VIGIWLAVDRWMKPSCASKSVAGRVSGSGEGGAWSRILYQKVGAEDGIADDPTRSGNDFLIDELGTFSASKADLDTATVFLVLLALQDHQHAFFRKLYETY
jgi:hypothetical protein